MSNLLIISITLIFSAFFSGMEVALLNANKLQIELDKYKGSFSSKIISIFIRNPSKFITTMLVGNNIALVIYGLIMAKILEPYLILLISSPALVLLTQTILSTGLILIVGEFLPILIFRIIANPALKGFAPFLLLFYILFYPITWLISNLSNLIISFIKGGDLIDEKSNQIFNKLDLLHFIDHASEGELSHNEKETDIKFFQNALDFSNVKLRDCMVPRTEIHAVDINTSLNDLRNEFINTGYSKILVYTNSIDEIEGYITSKSLFDNPPNIKSKLLSVSYVPETMPAHKLLAIFIQEKKSMAVVVDEFGGVSGMLTIEDILEEIFGEIEDEHDVPELIEKKISELEYIFSGRMEIDYIRDKYNIDLPVSEDYETLAGFIYHHYENIPKQNEFIEIDLFQFKILKASNTRVELVHITLKR